MCWWFPSGPLDPCENIKPIRKISFQFLVWCIRFLKWGGFALFSRGCTVRNYGRCKLVMVSFKDRFTSEGLMWTRLVFWFACSFAAGLGAAFFASGSALSRPSERYRTRHKTNDSDDCVQPKFLAAIALLFCTLFFGFVFFLAIIREVRKGMLTSPLPQILPPMATARQPSSSPAPPPPPSSSPVRPVSDQSPV